MMCRITMLVRSARCMLSLVLEVSLLFTLPEMEVSATATLILPVRLLIASEVRSSIMLCSNNAHILLSMFSALPCGLPLVSSFIFVHQRRIY